jgi:hypothetical protein
VDVSRSTEHNNNIVQWNDQEEAIAVKEAPTYSGERDGFRISTNCYKTLPTNHYDCSLVDVCANLVMGRHSSAASYAMVLFVKVLMACLSVCLSRSSAGNCSDVERWYYPV